MYVSNELLEKELILLHACESYKIRFIPNKNKLNSTILSKLLY